MWLCDTDQYILGVDLCGYFHKQLSVFGGSLHLKWTTLKEKKWQPNGKIAISSIFEKH